MIKTDEDIIDSLDEIGQHEQVEIVENSDPADIDLIVRELDDKAIMELEKAKPKKKKGSCNYKLSLANTMRSSRFYSPPATDPMETGGLSCKKCGKMVDLDDYLGTPDSSGFKSVGYHCHKCNHRWLRQKYHDEESRCGQSYMTKGKWEIKRC